MILMVFCSEAEIYRSISKLEVVDEEPHSILEVINASMPLFSLIGGYYFWFAFSLCCSCSFSLSRSYLLSLAILSLVLLGFAFLSISI